jgi:hypothetical protein
LREATARYEPDYTLSDESGEAKPRRRRKSVSPAAARAAENRARFVAAIRYTLDHPIRVLGAACLIVAFTSFTLNALFFQKGQHPAPLFAPKSDAQANAPASLPVPTPPQSVALPPERPADLAPRKDSAPPPASASSASAQPRDAIGDLLRGGQAPQSADPKLEQARTLASAQRALNRLGYGPIKADGLYGAGTKSAIEKFQRDRKLPVSGELSPRVLKELAAASGQTID